MFASIAVRCKIVNCIIPVDLNTATRTPAAPAPTGRPLAKGIKAKGVALHAPFTNTGNFDQNGWELYHVDADRSESKNLAKDHPDKRQALIKAWFD